MGTFHQKVDADNLISTAQAQSGTLVTTTADPDRSDPQWHVDLSNQTLSNGSYIDYQFPGIPQSIKVGMSVDFKIKLLANSGYYVHSGNIKHVVISDSSGKIVYDGTTGIMDENKYIFFRTGSTDDVYTIKYDGFDETLTGSWEWGVGDQYPQLGIYQALSNNETIDINLEKPMLGYGQTDGYAYAINSANTDKFKLSSKGVSSDNHPSSGYSIKDVLRYYPVLGYYDSGDTIRGLSATTGSMDGNTVDSNGGYGFGSTPSAPAIKFDKIYYYKDNDTHGHIYSTPNFSTSTGGYKIKNLMRHLNFWQRFKSYLGDPVDTFSGAFIDQRTLMTYSGNNPLHFDISYNSVTDGGTALGQGYTHNFDTSLTKDDDGTIHVYWSPNVVSDFKYDSATKTYTAVDSKQNSIHVLKTDTGYTVDNPEDGFYVFDNNGKLLSKKDKVGQVVSYEYTDNKLSKVSNNRNQSYSFVYDGDRISKITDGTGRSITLGYASGWSDYRLSKVTFSDGKVLSITTDGTRITNMSYAGSHLISNTYDAFGRVIYQQNNDGTSATYSYDESSVPGQMITKRTVAGKTVTSVHDNSGNLLSQIDENGNTVSYKYNSDNQQIAKTDAEGNTSAYEYNDENHISKQIDPLHQITNYLYNNNNQLASVVTPDGYSNKLVYDNDNKLVSSTDKGGLETTYQYDKFNNPTIIEIVKDGKVYSHTENQYDVNGYLIATIVNGKKTSFVNDVLGRKVTTIMPNGTSIKYTYDNDNHILTSSVNDKVTQFKYDSLGQLTTKILPNGHQMRYFYRAFGKLSGTILQDNVDEPMLRYYYDDDSGLLTDITGSRTNIAEYKYDDTGNVTSFTDYNGNTSVYTYNKNNQQVSTTVNDTTTKVAYDGDGQITSTTNGNSNTTSNEYDKVGNLIKQTLPDGSTVMNTYDAMGHMLTTSSNGKTAKYDYDVLGNRISSVDAEGNKTSYAYNADGQVISSTNALGHKVSYIYNDEGQLAKTLNNRDEVTAEYKYDDSGNVISVSNAQNIVRTMTYDVNNNLLTVKDANGDLVGKSEFNSDDRLIATINTLNSKSSYSYQYASNVNQLTTTITNALGHKQSTTTDYGGNVIKSADDVTSGVASYDAVGNLSSQSVNNGQNKTSLTYDKDQNVVSEANNDGSESYSYDALDQLSSWTNARGDKTVYTRDVDGNITNAKASDVDNNYGYDVNGNETSAKNSNADISKTYDALNRVVSKTQNGQTIKYNYDDREFLTDLIYPGDKKVHYDVNTDGQITAMTDWNNHKTTYDYDKNGRIVKTTNWNGVVESRTYNTAGQVLTIKTSLHDKTLTDYKYSYDADGNLVTDNSQTYTYDMLDRLTAGQNNYAYDAIGNITSVGNHKMVIRRLLIKTVI